MTFKDEHRELQELVRELNLLRQHNLRFRPGMSLDTLLIMSEAAMTLVTFERFLRILPDLNAEDSDTIDDLLKRATKRGGPLYLHDRTATIRKIGRIRNALLHGNFEQEARRLGYTDLRAYFQKFDKDVVEDVFQLLDNLMAQIDRDTGYRRTDLPTTACRKPPSGGE
jgi:hypothetical protein